MCLLENVFPKQMCEKVCKLLGQVSTIVLNSGICIIVYNSVGWKRMTSENIAHTKYCTKVHIGEPSCMVGAMWGDLHANENN